MAEKLTLSAWTGFVRKHKLELDDAALQKALAKVDKTRTGKPDARLSALEEAATAIGAQSSAVTRRRKVLGDEGFERCREMLELLADETAAQLREARLAAEQEDEEEDSPALLSARMLPLLRELRKGEARMHALIALAGKQCGVLIMKRPIAASRRKLVADFLGASAGVRYLPAECVGDGALLTFVMQKQVGGLAKRLRAALLEQTGLRIRVKVRAGDGEEEDGEDVEEGADPSADDVTKPVVGAPAAAAAAPAASVRPAMLYGQVRLAWGATRKKVRAELQALEQAILRHYRGLGHDLDAVPEFSRGLRRLDRVLDLFDASLEETMDAAAQASDPRARQRLHDAARATIAKYRALLQNEPLLQELDANPFAPTTVRATLSNTLTLLASKLT